MNKEKVEEIFDENNSLEKKSEETSKELKQKNPIKKINIFLIVFLCLVVVASSMKVLYFRTNDIVGGSKTIEIVKKVNDADKMDEVHTYTNTFYTFSFDYPSFSELIEDSNNYSKTLRMTLRSDSIVNNDIVIMNFDNLEMLKTQNCAGAKTVDNGCLVTKTVKKIKNVEYYEYSFERNKQTRIVRYIEKADGIVAFYTISKNANFTNNLSILDSLFESLTFAGEWDSYITAKIRVQDKDGNPIADIPMKFIQPIGDISTAGNRSAQYNVYNTDTNGEIEIKTFPKDDVFILSAHPDYRIEDDFCASDDKIDCRYSLKNFDTRALVSPGKASEAEGHRTYFEDDGESKDIQLVVTKPRISDTTYYNEQRYTYNRKCGSYYTNSNKKVHDRTIENISGNIDYKRHIQDGYNIKDVCDYNNKTMIFMDYSDRYWREIDKKSDDELNRIATKVLLGFTDKSYEYIDFFETSVEGYRYEGTGNFACNIDKYKDNYILYICDDGNDSESMRTWYAFDMKEKKNHKVKDYIFKSGAEEGQISGTLYREDLFMLFSERGTEGVF